MDQRHADRKWTNFTVSVKTAHVWTWRAVAAIFNRVQMCSQRVSFKSVQWFMKYLSNRLNVHTHKHSTWSPTFHGDVRPTVKSTQSNRNRALRKRVLVTYHQKSSAPPSCCTAPRRRCCRLSPGRCRSCWNAARPPCTPSLSPRTPPDGKTQHNLTNVGTHNKSCIMHRINPCALTRDRINQIEAKTSACVFGCSTFIINERYKNKYDIICCFSY